MKTLAKITVVGSLVWLCYGVANEFYVIHRRQVNNAYQKAYQKGRTDCVDDFVRGLAFTNGKTVTIESEHNGSITVKTIG